MIQVDGVGTASDPSRAPEKDAALAVVSDVAQEIDPVVAKKVLRKIDLYFMPAMLIGKIPAECILQDEADELYSGYGMVYYDKARKDRR